MIKIKIIIEKGEDGYVVASCPALKGCWSQGKTEKEAIDNIDEAIRLYLEPDPKDLRKASNRKIVNIPL